MNVKDTVEAFVAAINSGQADAVAALMTDDHLFVDSLGNCMEGRETMREGWTSYFQLFPDYRIEVDEIFASNAAAMLHGQASGTLHRDGVAVANAAWQIPVAWRAEVDGGKVRVWQVFADNSPIHDLLSQRR